MAGVEERYQLLLDDPDISKVEPHRVFCGRCDKWLKLDETKLYAASVWRCHKNTKSHNAKPPNSSKASGIATNQKSNTSLSLPSYTQKMLQDSTPGSSSRPRLRKSLNSSVHNSVPRLALKVPPSTLSCSTPPSDSSPVEPSTAHNERFPHQPSSPPSINSVDTSPLSNPPSKNIPITPSLPLSSISHSTSLPQISKSSFHTDTRTLSTSDGKQSPAIDLHIPLPSDLLPERQASYCALVAEPYITHLEPFRAFCALCRSWVSLSSRTQYSYGVWKGHIRKSEKHIRLQSSQADNDDTTSDHSAGVQDASEPLDNTIQEVEINAQNGVNNVTNGLGSTNNPSSSGARHDTGGSSTTHSENPFTLKATTSKSFDPRNSGTVVEFGSDFSVIDCDITEESDGVVPQSQQKLSPAKARAKRRDAMLADPDAAIVESRRVQCRICDRWIKGSNTQEYSSHHWLKHKKKCAQAHLRDNDRLSETAETRKQRLEADPDLDVLEPHRALCKLCGKWVKLCSRSLYSASHWIQHKKKCPVTQGGASSNAQTDRAESSGATLTAADTTTPAAQASAVEERRAGFLSDPDVLQLLPDRVQCKVCDRWIRLGKNSNVNWLLHKECCAGVGDNVGSVGRQRSSLEARKKALEEDSDVAYFEPHRVRCANCNSWIKLRQDSSYSLSKWLIHKRRCGQTHELSSTQGARSGDGLKKGANDSFLPEGNDDDVRVAMDVENWLKDEAAAGSSHGKVGLGGRVVETNVDRDVDMGDGGLWSNDNSLLGEHQTNGKRKRDQNDHKAVPGTKLAKNVEMATDEDPEIDPRKGSGEPSQKVATKAKLVVSSSQNVRLPLQHSVPTRRRGRGKGQSVSLPKVKARAAAFMRGHSAMTLPPLPMRPRWPDEEERKRQFLSDPDVVRVEPHRLLCKCCKCWIRLHPIIRYSQSVWPQHKESCKASHPFSSNDPKSLAKSEKEDARQRLLDEDPYATDVSPHRVTCKACGTNIRLDTTYKYEGSHWRAHRSRCPRIPFHDRLTKKRKTIENPPEPIAIIDSSDSENSDASSAPRPRSTSIFTDPLIIKPTEMFKRRSSILLASSSQDVGAAIRTKAQIEADLSVELEKVAAQLEAHGRFATILKLYGDGVTSEELVGRTAQGPADDDMDVSPNDHALVPSPRPQSDLESWVPRGRTPERVQAFDDYFAQRPLPPASALLGNKLRTCKLGKEDMLAID